MPPTSFTAMAGAIRELVRIDLGVIERMSGLPKELTRFDVDAMWARDVYAREGAEMLARLIPHEGRARDLAAPGALVHFPLFSPDVVGLVPGDVVLVRGTIVETAEAQCRVAFKALGGWYRFWSGHGDVVAVERPVVAPVLAHL